MSIQLGTITGTAAIAATLALASPAAAINCRSGSPAHTGQLDGDALLPGCPAGSGRAGERLRGLVREDPEQPQLQERALSRCVHGHPRDRHLPRCRRAGVAPLAL